MNRLLNWVEDVIGDVCIGLELLLLQNIMQLKSHIVSLSYIIIMWHIL
jgi:hypothetical protein